MRYTVTVQVDVSKYDESEYESEADVALALREYFQSPSHGALLTEQWSMRVADPRVSQVEWGSHMLAMFKGREHESE